MKATYYQIEKALNNTLKIGTDGSRELYDAVRSCKDAAIVRVGIDVEKTEHHFSNSDWSSVYVEIKKMIGEQHPKN